MAKPFGTRSFAALTAILLASAAAIPAEAANPELKALVRGVADEKSRSADLRIETMDVAVRTPRRHRGDGGDGALPQ